MSFFGYIGISWNHQDLKKFRLQELWELIYASNMVVYMLIDRATARALRAYIVDYAVFNAQVLANTFNVYLP